MKLKIVALIFILAFTVHGQLMEYDGTLTDLSGNPVSDGVYAVTFAIYDRPEAGLLLWQSAGETNVMVINGKFKHVLGSTSILPDSLSNYNSLWLELYAQSTQLSGKRTFLEYPAIKNNSTPQNQAELNNSIDESNAISYPDPESIGRPTRTMITEQQAMSNLNTKYWSVLLKLGYDFSGTHKASIVGVADKQDVKSGICGSAELLSNDYKQSHQFGLGLEFQLPRELENLTGKFKFVSIYGTIKLIASHDELKNDYPFISARVGYGLLSGDSEYKGTGPYSVKLKGGLTYGVGLGMIIDRAFLIELAYVQNNSAAEYNNHDIDIKYSRILLSLGFNFEPKP